MLCNEHGLFLEIAEVIRNLDLSILKGTIECHSNNTWAHFIVEVLISLKVILDIHFLSISIEPLNLWDPIRIEMNLHHFPSSIPQALYSYTVLCHVRRVQRAFIGWMFSGVWCFFGSVKVNRSQPSVEPFMALDGHGSNEHYYNYKDLSFIVCVQHHALLCVLLTLDLDYPLKEWKRANVHAWQDLYVRTSYIIKRTLFSI